MLFNNDSITRFVYSSVAAMVSDTRFAVDASDLLIPPGVWPCLLATDIGDGSRFSYVSHTDDAGEYVQKSTGITLIVFND